MPTDVQSWVFWFISVVLAGWLINLTTPSVLPTLSALLYKIKQFLASNNRRVIQEELTKKERELARLEYHSLQPERVILYVNIYGMISIWLALVGIIAMSPQSFPDIYRFFRITDTESAFTLGVACFIAVPIILIVLGLENLGYPDFIDRKKQLQREIDDLRKKLQ